MFVVVHTVNACNEEQRMIVELHLILVPSELKIIPSLKINYYGSNNTNESICDPRSAVGCPV